MAKQLESVQMVFEGGERLFEEIEPDMRGGSFRRGCDALRTLGHETSESGQYVACRHRRRRALRSDRRLRWLRKIGDRWAGHASDLSAERWIVNGLGGASTTRGIG